MNNVATFIGLHGAVRFRALLNAAYADDWQAF